MSRAGLAVLSACIALVLPAAPAAAEAGASIVVPGGDPVVARLHLDAPIVPTDVTLSAGHTVAVLTFAKAADGMPLVTVLVDPTMDAYDAPSQLPNPIDVPSVLAAGYTSNNYDKQLPAGDYLVYAASTAHTVVTLASAPSQLLSVAPTDRMQVGFTVLTPELGTTDISSRITTQRLGKSVTTSLGLVALRYHQQSTLETRVSAVGATCSGAGAGAGQRATRLSPGSVGNGWNAMSWNVFPGTFDNVAVDAYFHQTGVTFYHRATVVGLTIHAH